MSFSSCTSPTDVDANRVRKITETQKTISFNYYDVDLEYVELNNFNDFPVTVQNETAKFYLASPIRLASGLNVFTTDSSELHLEAKGDINSYNRIFIKFSPKAIGIYKDTIFFNEAKTPYILVRGICPSIFISNATIPETQLGKTTLSTIYVKNYTDKAIVFDKYLINGDFDCFNIDNFQSGISISPNDSYTLNVSYTPKKAVSNLIKVNFYFKGLNNTEIYKSFSIISGLGIK